MQNMYDTGIKGEKATVTTEVEKDVVVLTIPADLAPYVSEVFWSVTAPMYGDDEVLIRAAQAFADVRNAFGAAGFHGSDEIHAKDSRSLTFDRINNS